MRGPRARATSGDAACMAEVSHGHWEPWQRPWRHRRPWTARPSADALKSFFRFRPFLSELLSVTSDQKRRAAHDSLRMACEMAAPSRSPRACTRVAPLCTAAARISCDGRPSPRDALACSLHPSLASPAPATLVHARRLAPRLAETFRPKRTTKHTAAAPAVRWWPRDWSSELESVHS